MAQPVETGSTTGEYPDDEQVSINHSLIGSFQPSEPSTRRSPVSALSLNEPHEDEYGSSSQNEKKRKHQNKYLVWWPEGIAMLCSMMLMVAIVAVLIAFDNKPLNSWNLPWHVKPNALISILMTLCKFAMLIVVGECLGQLKWHYFGQRSHPLSHFQIFDEASRGPWGSMFLIFTVRLGAVVASLGALIMILALAMDPFSQQVLSYVPRNSTDLSASIRMATAYDYNSPFATVNSNEPDVSNNQGHQNSFVMTGAILASLINTPTPMQYTCVTGNCTWPTFTSLGICSTCLDVSDHLHSTCESRDLQTSPLDLGYRRQCTYTTPIGSKLNVVSSMEMHSVSASGGNFTLFSSTGTEAHDLSNSTQLSNTTNAYVLSTNKITLPTLAQLSSLRLPPDWFNGCGSISPSDCPVPRPQAYDCTLSLCAKNYGADAVVSGALYDTSTEDVVLEFPFEPKRDYPTNPGSRITSSDIYNKCLPINQKSTNSAGYGFIWPALRLAAFPKDSTPSGVTCLDFANKDQYPDAFWVNYDDVEHIGVTMADLFTQSLQNGGTNFLSEILYNANDGNFSRTLDIVALGMTNAMRQGPNGTNAPGNTVSEVITIQVNWPWLIFPAGLVLMTLFFMLATFFFSRHTGNTVWKSSSLAILFHGLSGWTAQDGDVYSLKGMEASAKHLTAALELDEDGELKLVKR